MKDKAGLLLFRIETLFLKDCAVPPPVTLTTNGPVLPAPGNSNRVSISKVVIIIMQPYLVSKGYYAYLALRTLL